MAVCYQLHTQNKPGVDESAIILVKYYISGLTEFMY